LAFSKPDFEILAFLTPLAFVGNKKPGIIWQILSGFFCCFFSAGKAWLWQNIV